MIDDKLINAYLTELDALRDHGRELARTHPEVAARLDIGPRASRDPDVERVVESAAFLAARLRLMIESRSTEIPLAMLTLLAPALVEPVPSMALVEFGSGTERQRVPRGARFEFQINGQAIVCFSTTMATTAVPIGLQVQRLGPTGGHADGIGLRITGTPDERLLLCLGNDNLTASLLMDAFADALSAIEVVGPRGGAPVRAPASALRIHGFSPNEAALPVRAAVHRAHRVVTEFMAFPQKFRFVSLSGLPLRSGSQIRFWFSRRLALPPRLPQDLISTNRVPAVNLWAAAASPFDLTGRSLEYPVRVDALRYRTVECHSVESVGLYNSGGKHNHIDPLISFGDVRGTTVRWGMRRTVMRAGGAVFLYFQGLDFQTLGRERLLAVPQVLASNRDVARRTPFGAQLHPVESFGDWRCRVASTPTPYRPAITDSRAMEILVGYLQSSMSSMGGVGRNRGSLRDFLSRFPGGGDAGWLRGLGPVSFRHVAAMRGGEPHPGLAVLVTFDKTDHHTTSAAMVKRVLGLLIDSQRGVNRVEDVIVRTT